MAKEKKIVQKEILTPQEYAKLRGITAQAVTKQIRNGKALRGISEVQSYGRFYLLKVANWDEIKK